MQSLIPPELFMKRTMDLVPREPGLPLVRVPTITFVFLGVCRKFSFVMLALETVFFGFWRQNL
jgi:hypothetical protein